jgi:hypothetical protein
MPRLATRHKHLSGFVRMSGEPPHGKVAGLWIKADGFDSSPKTRCFVLKLRRKAKSPPNCSLVNAIAGAPLIRTFGAR